jgi:ribosomal protein S18 acetylase RimI-like enzyme
MRGNEPPFPALYIGREQPSLEGSSREIRVGRYCRRVRIERVKETTDELVAAFARLIPQLSADRLGPAPADLAQVLESPGTIVLVARDEEAIVGTLTLLLYRIPTGARGWIHDVVVDDASRNRGVGEALTREALELAREAGVENVQLTTRRQRESAHRLYRRLGFVQRESDVFVWRPQ